MNAGAVWCKYSDQFVHECGESDTGCCFSDECVQDYVAATETGAASCESADIE